MNNSLPDQQIVELSGVRKAFVEGAHEHIVFRDLALEVLAGESLALTGRSGAGKSTLLNLVAGIDTADAGSVTILGRPLASLDDAARTRLRRQHVGFVFQFFNLLPALSVLDNVCLPLKLLNVPHAQATERAMSMLARVGLDGRAQALADRLSGGEQQRVAIARAVVHEPSLVLADEPTGNLDAGTAADILALLRSLASTDHRALIMATHSPEAAAICSRDVRIETLDNSL